MSENNPYSDIIDLPHHQSAVRKHMSAIDRAAQFAPFAALVGYESAIEETARLTEQQIELDESRRLVIGERLQQLSERQAEKPAVTVTWFRPDEKKEGGAVRTDCAKLLRVEPLAELLVLAPELRIPFSSIYSLEFEPSEPENA